MSTTFRRASVALATVGCLLAAGAGTAQAQGSTSGNKLQCFDTTSEGYPADPASTCVLDGGRGATLTNPAGTYSGVYVLKTNIDGKRLATVNKLSFSYAGDDPAGALRITIPVDVDGDGMWDDFVSAGADNCNDGEGNVDVINDETCLVGFNSGTYYASWAELVAANPTVTVATDASPFVIADQEGTWTVSNVSIGRGAASARTS